MRLVIVAVDFEAMIRATNIPSSLIEAAFEHPDPQADEEITSRALRVPASQKKPYEYLYKYGGLPRAGRLELACVRRVAADYLRDHNATR
jgi:hypothetical protein